MTTIACIADTHGLHDELSWTLEPCDIAIHAGDFLDTRILNSVRATQEFGRWFKSLPAKHHICIAGNHDRFFEKDKILGPQILVSLGIIYLEDTSCTVMDLNIHGSPWTPWFNNWAFNASRGAQIQRHWDKIPSDTNILITHGPMAGIRDVTADMRNVGCENLRARIQDLPNLRMHICGHIHEGYGQQTWNGITYVNASILDEHYRPIHSPIIVEL